MIIALGLPTNRGFRHQTTQSLLDLVAQNKEYEFIPITETEGMTIEDNRNNIVERAKKADYLLFIDDDMVFPPTLLKDLLKHKKDVIGVNSRTKSGRPTVKLSGIQRAMIPSTLFSCDQVGTGIMLIDCKIFKHPEFKPPYFKFERYATGKVKKGEDIYFCDSVRSLGYEVWCDPKIEIKHIADNLL